MLQMYSSTGVYPYIQPGWSLRVAAGDAQRAAPAGWRGLLNSRFLM